MNKPVPPPESIVGELLEAGLWGWVVLFLCGISGILWILLIIDGVQASKDVKTPGK